MAFAFRNPANEIEGLKRRCSLLEGEVVRLMLRIDRLETALLASRREQPRSPAPSYEQPPSPPPSYQLAVST